MVSVGARSRIMLATNEVTIREGVRLTTPERQRYHTLTKLTN